MCEAFFELFKDEVAAKIAAAQLETEERVRQENKAEVSALKRELAELKKKLAIKLGKTKWLN